MTVDETQYPYRFCERVAQEVATHNFQDIGAPTSVNICDLKAKLTILAGPTPFQRVVMLGTGQRI